MTLEEDRLFISLCALTHVFTSAVALFVYDLSPVGVGTRVLFVWLYLIFDAGRVIKLCDQAAAIMKERAKELGMGPLRWGVVWLGPWLVRAAIGMSLCAAPLVSAALIPLLPCIWATLILHGMEDEDD